ncbi:hypothetical protein FHETE_1862 [Fusarium heterosporum]|uniref:Uncharacterized protein n=1 Tax=Fusarium heterosporum TaxID=42747 RepID=A0A8H5TS25_FUSHE|nr:hypothetical protein FHETE_1862 [Fusarium heterosporum]
MLNCTAPYLWEAIEASSDIIGPGVLSSFFATASITIIAVIVAYLSDSIEGKFINELDRMVIGWSMTTFPFLWACIRGQPGSDHGKACKTSPEWKEAVLQFILTLSDQQLVTGLAILISGIANQNSLYGYEYTIMTCLAWFSSTTHLATMDALRSYFTKHKSVRNIRVIGIITVLFMLIYAFVVTTNVAVIYELRTVKVQCLFEDSTYVSYKSKLRLVAWILSSVLIVLGYVVRVVDLYPDELSDIVKRAASLMKLNADSSAPPPSPSTTEQGWRARFESRRGANKVLSIVRVLLRGSKAYNTSFLSSLSTISFSFTFGLSQLSLYRWRLAPLLSPGTNNMDFGQLFPVFLLALPFLSAIETYCGYRDRRKFSSDEQKVAASSELHLMCEPLYSRRSSDQIQQSEGQAAGRRREYPTARVSLGSGHEWSHNGHPARTRAFMKGSNEHVHTGSTCVYSSTELNIGLALFFLAFVGSILLGVFLNGASVNNNGLTYAAIGIFLLAFAYQVVKLILFLRFDITNGLRERSRVSETGVGTVEMIQQAVPDPSTGRDETAAGKMNRWNTF